MEKPSINKQDAIRQIDEIYELMKGNLKAAISGAHMIAVGIMVMLIPFIEYVLHQTMDQALPQHYVATFALRTAFYWSIFYIIARTFKTSSKKDNIVTQKIRNIGKLYPIIPIATAAMLGYIGQTNLIAPIILILIGTLLVLFGEFASYIVSVIGWLNIAAGIIGMYLSTYAIDNFWVYLVIDQGLFLVIMGSILLYIQNKNK